MSHRSSVRTNVTAVRSKKSKLPALRHPLLAGAGAIALLTGCPLAATAKPLGGQQVNPSAAAIAAQQAAQLEATRAARDAQNALKRATLSIQAMQASQQMARDAARAQLNAMPNIVPDGLRTGGLVVGKGLWQGADLPTEIRDGDNANVTVKQTQQKAILEWETFNVGGKTELYFDQRAGGSNASEWIALNRVLGNDAPSKILGSIKAEGQVYVINRNGIIFGGASQVNVGTLIASSLSLSNEQFMAGIATAITAPGMGSDWTISLPTFGDHGVPIDPSNSAAQQPQPAFVPGTAPGDVTVEAGAMITTAAGGKAMLFAPHVSNGGTIAANNGQVILAAGEQVYLRPSLDVRGLDVAVSAPMPWLFPGSWPFNPPNPNVPAIGVVQNLLLQAMEQRAAEVGYSVVNTGVVKSTRGDITLHGRDIVQAGLLYANTALNNLGGSVRLQAWSQGALRYFIDGDPQLASWKASTLTLGESSVIMVEPDLSDISEIEGSSLATRYEPGRVELRGYDIHVKSGASVIVPAGSISILASAQPAAPLEPNAGNGGVADGSLVHIDDGAYLSVAGLQDVLLAMDRNIIEATLGINELRDSPLYRDSWLRGVEVKVDRRDGGVFTDGPMAGVDWGGEAGKWTGTQLADLSAWIGIGRTDLAELSAEAGSIFIKSGGSVITRPGSILDVSGGSVRYKDGWIATTKLLGADGHIYDIGEARPDQAYVALADGFTRYNAKWGITETWANPLGKTQRRFEKGYTEGRNAGSVTIYAGEAFVLEGQIAAGVVAGERQIATGAWASAGTLEIGDVQTANAVWTPDNVVISDTPIALADDLNNLGAFYDAATGSTNLYLDADMLSGSGLGAINLNVRAGFDVTAGTELTLDPGAKLRVNGSANVVADFVRYNIGGTIRIAGGDVDFTGTIHNVTLGAQSAIDVSGQWVNELTDGFVSARQRTNGGTIGIDAIALDAGVGAILDVSGGALLSLRSGEIGVKSGDAGKITLTGVNADGVKNLDLRGYAAGSGASLDITTDAAVQLGGDAPADTSVMHIGNSLFSDRGFRSLSVTTSQGIAVPDGAQLKQVATSIDLAGNSVLTAGSGGSITDIGRLAVLPLWQRVAMAANTLTLAAGGDVVVAAGASITTDVRGAVNLGGANVTVDGAIEAPAGSIALSATTGNIAIGNAAALLARGTAVIQPRGVGRSSEVLDGGSISLSSVTYNMGAETLIDVSGATATVDSDTRTPQAVALSSNGGSISFAGGGIVQGRLFAHAGGPNAIGGMLSVSNEGGAGGSSPFDLLRSILEGLIPDDTNGDGEFTWEDSIGYDYSQWGLPSGQPFIFTREFVDAIQQTPSLTVTETLPTGGGLAAVDPTQYGFSHEDILELEAWGGVPEWNLYNVGAAVANTPPAPTVIASLINNGGFADLSLATANTIKFDAVNLSLARSISLKGAVVSSGTSSALTASYIQLAGGDANSAPSLAGTLTLNSKQTDIHNANSIRGYQRAILQSDSIRFTSQEVDRASGLEVDGDLTLKAGVIYPGTAIKATLTAGNSITIEQNGARSLPLSAAGSLTLRAPEITQSGSLVAPFGSIAFDASSSLTLAAGSLTSVSGAGLDALYGTLLNNESWQVDSGTGAPTSIAALPEKKITLNGSNVAVEDGSVVDISGGGDLHAWQFVPGPGGSHDILNLPGMYAILPSQASAASDTGTRIWLGGGKGLAAGWYTLLPARYALLPGAYAIQMVAGSSSPFTSTPSQVMKDGTAIMAGRVGDMFTGTSDQFTSAWRVMSGSVLRQYSEYNEASANSFFSSDAFKLTQYRLTGQNIVTPRLPQDGGAVVFKATQELILEGGLKSSAPGGRGGLVDIAGSKIAILGAGENGSALKADGYLVLDAASLSGFGASSLLIGGSRSGDPLGLRVEVTATDIIVRNNEATALTGPEIILVASSLVDVREGSAILASGEVASGGSDLVMTPQIAAVYVDPQGWDDGNPADDILVTPSKDYGALLRVATGDAVRVLRENVDTTIGGVVNIGAGVQLGGGKALLIDATRTTNLSGTAQLSGSSLSVASGRIGLGGGSDGLILSLASLQRLAATQHLTLRSYSSIDFHASVNFGGAGFAAVTLDAGAIAGYGNNNIVVSGGTIALENSGGGAATAGTGTGTLALTANELLLGRGAKTVSGFSSVILTGTNGIVGQGKGSFDGGAAALTLATPMLTGRQAANQTVSTTGALSLIGTGGTSTLAVVDSLGSILSLSGGNVALGSRIVAVGGAVEVTATAGDAVIDAGALIDVGGFAKQFFDVPEYAHAGRIGLTAIGGDVLLKSGATLSLAAASGGGNAGKLAVTAAGGGTIVLDGAIAAQAGSGGKGGSFALDIDALADFAGLGEKLNASGFFASRQFRVRNGDVEINGLTRVEDFALSADAGAVTITGTVDARATYGGRIAISGGDGVVMKGSAKLIAGATDTQLGSGRVTLESGNGDLNVEGGTMDVSGGEGGVVRFRAQREASPDLIKVTNLAADIFGDRLRVLEGIASYQSTDGTVSSQWGAAAAEANAFAANASAIVTRLGGASGVTVMAGIEITSDGDLTLGSDLDLANAFGASLRSGSLTLRAAGNLTINGNISDGFSNASATGTLLTGESWDLRLVAGADLTSADALGVTPLAGLAAAIGTISIGSESTGKVIRTGSGDIAVVAGRDVRFANVASAVYTAGKRDITAYSDFSPKADAVYATGGGHLAVAAGGDIAVNIKPTEGQFFTDWLIRTGAVNANTGLFNAGPGGQSSWWIKHSAFQQGVGALGGGNVSVSAGGDLGNLVVSLATTGRVHGGMTSPSDKLLEVDNGGAMTVTAGGAILGGQYYAGRGEASISAASLRVGREVSVTSGVLTTVTGLAPVLALGDASMSVTAAGDMLVQTVADPLLAYSPNFTSYMSGYTDRTEITLMSVGGDITLTNRSREQNDFPVRDNGLSLSNRSAVGKSANRYPGKTRIVALNGSVMNLGLITTMPSSSADLSILAADDVALGSILTARATAAAIPSPFGPTFEIGNLNSLLQNRPWTGGPTDPTLYLGGNPDQLDLIDDYEPSRIYALTGSIDGTNRMALSGSSIDVGLIGVTTNEQTWFKAGKDIRQINFRLRNLHATDVSLLHAGNDIISGMEPGFNSGIEIQGPGALLLSAGRDIYAQTLDIYSVGNRAFNYSTNTPHFQSEIKGLPAQGADITLLAGINSEIKYDAFASAYLDPANVANMASWLTATENGVKVPLYLTDAVETSVGGAEHVARRGLVSFVKEITGETLSPLEAWARFNTLPKLVQQEFVRDVYMQELRAAGRDQLTTGADGQPINGGYNRGYAAIAALFPGDAWKGNVQFGNGLIRTMSGGDIRVLTPGGELQIAALNTAVGNGHGLVTLGYGRIDIFAHRDVVVNRSRILTFGGGDEILWSTLGDIDAGRGAKTARVPSRPEVIIDADGNVRIVEKPDIGGSGIGTIEGFEGAEPGDVDLIAPKGTVNAGDAGIRVAGNLNLAALHIVNAANIEVQGKSKGVPVIEAPDIGGLSEASNTAGAAAQEAATPNQNKATAQPSVIIVEVIGFGGGGDDGSPSDGEQRRKERGQRDGNYNPNSRLQVIGLGELTEAQKHELTETERRSLNAQ